MTITNIENGRQAKITSLSFGRRESSSRISRERATRLREKLGEGAWKTNGNLRVFVDDNWSDASTSMLRTVPWRW